MLQNYEDIVNDDDHVRFTKAKTLFVKDCQPEFVRKFIRRHIFPNVTVLYLSSNPCLHSGILKEFSNVTVTENHANQLEIFKPGDYKRIINHGYLEAILKSYYEEDIIFERDDGINQELYDSLNRKIMKELNKLKDDKMIL